MPELPEVETVRNTLKKLILNKQITGVDVYYDRIIQNVTKEDFIKDLIGQTFIDIKRKGKFLIFILDKYIMVSHLRMEGKYFLKTNEPVEKHEHIIFHLGEETLRYIDTRKFGVIYLFKQSFEEVEKLEPLNKLGYEPLSDDLTKDYLKSKITKLHKPIKTILLDQTIISGLGNIYVDEVCFMCKLNPDEEGLDLDDNDINNIIINSRKVLEKAITLGGTTIRTFMSSHDVSGRFQNELLVHTKETCPICQSKIIKSYVNGRGTYYCPNCQKRKKHYKIGLTGGIACGKSSVLDYMKKLGYNVIDCDDIVHHLLEKNNQGYIEVVKTFPNILNENNEIDRNKLGSIVFNNIEEKQKLESILHPLVKKIINELNEDVIVEVPLLFEARMELFFDKIIVISSTLENQITRLKERNNYTDEEAILRINNQMSLLEKENKADYVIHNDGNINELHKQIKKVLIEIGL